MTAEEIQLRLTRAGLSAFIRADGSVFVWAEDTKIPPEQFAQILGESFPQENIKTVVSMTYQVTPNEPKQGVAQLTAADIQIRLTRAGISAFVMPTGTVFAWRDGSNITASEFAAALGDEFSTRNIIEKAPMLYEVIPTATSGQL